MKAAPLLISFSSVEDYLSALAPPLREIHESEIRRLVNLGLPPIVSTRCLATLLGYSSTFVKAIQKRNVKYYREFQIRKGQQKRSIQAPKVALKVIQKWIGHHLGQSLEFEECVYGYVKGRSAKQAALQHIGADWVYSVDIKNFFPTTNLALIEQALISAGYSSEASKNMGPLLCFEKHLAQGAPSSPVISNLVMKPYDRKLLEISKFYDVTYTRYADDMVFSGKNDFPENLKVKVDELFSASDWTLSETKRYFADSRIGQRLKVHGLLVQSESVKLTRGYRNKIRAYKHMLKSGKVNSEDELRLEGHVKYSDYIDDSDR